MTWKIECSMGGALVLGRGLKYREIMVIPLENCSRGQNELLRFRGLGEQRPTNIFPRGVEGIKMIEIGQCTENLTLH